MNTNVKLDTEKVVNYLTKKQAWDYGYIRYSIFRKLICHVCGYKKTYLIRKVFLNMLELKLFQRKKTDKRSYLYQFRNPNQANVISKSITITFD